VTEKNLKWSEVINTVFLGVDCAVVLATVAFVVHKCAWLSLPVVFLPLFCAWSIGRRMAFGKWEREMDAKLKLLVELEQRRASNGRQAGCKCHWEEGDSPCPVHGEDEEA
jgi:hypothetical protein